MSDSPSLGNTIIDNLITRKEARADAIRRVRARDRIDFTSNRQSLWNKTAQLNAESPLTKALIKQKLDSSDFPTHLALIPDGNRRWARARDLTVGEGYGVGAEVIKEFRKWALVDNNISTVSAFLMSTENIEKRPENELKQLYNVFTDFFNGVPENDFVMENEIKHEVRGAERGFEMLPDEVNDAIENMETATEAFTGGKLVFLMPYGGRDEIIKAAKQSASPLGGATLRAQSTQGEGEDEFRQNLMLGDLPDVDLMVRTSEVRISNFMLYHNAYAEFVFFQKNWPSFSESDFYESIYKYSNRNRRFGV
jgi:tritrans,polycis-undecaprenyl-diphosphate synthase [geranylgeranyl-diphosphate specific]